MTVATSTRLPDTLAEWAENLAERSMQGRSAGTGLRIAADTLHSLTSSELTGLVWTVPELTLLTEAVGQPLLSTGVGRGILASELQDMTVGLVDVFADKHGFTAEQIAALVTRLRGLTPGQDWAVRDALSRWWADGDPTANSFRAVGFKVR